MKELFFFLIENDQMIDFRPFWEAKDQWLPTWNAATEDNAMQIDYIRVYSL